MPENLILASSSTIRSTLLRNAGVTHTVQAARVDEDSILSSMVFSNEKPRNIADALAEAKAVKISARNPGSLVLGSDQILSLDGKIFQKADNPDTLMSQLTRLSGQTHSLWTAAVIALDAVPQWRFVGRVDMSMRDLSAPFIESYVEQNWEDIRFCVGGYQFESVGLQLFSDVKGDYFHILGIPLLEVVNYLVTRRLIP